MDDLIKELEDILPTLCPACAKAVTDAMAFVSAAMAKERQATHEENVNDVEKRLALPGEAEAVLKGKK